MDEPLFRDGTAAFKWQALGIIGLACLLPLRGLFLGGRRVRVASKLRSPKLKLIIALKTRQIYLFAQKKSSDGG